MILKSTPKEAAKVNAPVDGRIMYSEERTQSIRGAMPDQGGENPSGITGLITHRILNVY